MFTVRNVNYLHHHQAQKFPEYQPPALVVLKVSLFVDSASASAPSRLQGKPNPQDLFVISLNKNANQSRMLLGSSTTRRRIPSSSSVASNSRRHGIGMEVSRHTFHHVSPFSYFSAEPSQTAPKRIGLMLRFRSRPEKISQSKCGSRREIRTEIHRPSVRTCRQKRKTQNR